MTPAPPTNRFAVSIAIVSDVHGNRHAFEAVLEDVVRCGCTEVWSLGDLVGYGASPNECVTLAQEHARVSLAGNHDLAVTGALAVEDFSEAARAAARWTRSIATAETLAYLEARRPQDGSGPVGLYHASPRDPVWEYVLSPLQAAECLDVQPERIALIGHSHVALAFWRAAEGVTEGAVRRDGDRADLAHGEWLLNPGSVGQPRDGDPRAAWLELDVEHWRAVYHRVDYDIEAAAEAIREAGLPVSLADRLRFGQ
jgi:diadenosine tetraphosphatase ApaH/serine/threonine PP2A family protein phosphatase